MKLDHLSASRIKTFEQCRLKYWAVYEQEMPETPHPLTLMGSSVHCMLEVATKARMAGARWARLHDPMVVKHAAMRKFKVDGSLGPTIDELTANAVRWGYFRNIRRTAGCELGFSFLLRDGTKVTGFVDRLDLSPPEADVIDIKTQKKAFEDAELKDNWQARIYNIGAREMFPEVTGKVSVSFWVLRHMVQRVWLTAHDAAATRGRLEEVAAEIRACKDPQGSPSGLCPWCPYHAECPEANANLKTRLKRWRK